MAWQKLDRLYRPMLQNWALRAGAQPADADEAASEVLCVLVSFLADFRYDPERSFRAYLKTMLRHQLSRLYRKTPATPSDSILQKMIVSKDSEAELVDLLIEKEERLKLAAILLIARQRCGKDSTWRAWEMTELEGTAAADVAKQLNIGVANVYVYRQRVAQLIQKVGAELRIADNERRVEQGRDSDRPENSQ